MAENCLSKWYQNVKKLNGHMVKWRKCTIFVPNKMTFHFRTLHETNSCSITEQEHYKEVMSPFEVFYWRMTLINKKTPQKVNILPASDRKNAPKGVDKCQKGVDKV